MPVTRSKMAADVYRYLGLAYVVRAVAVVTKRAIAVMTQDSKTRRETVAFQPCGHVANPKVPAVLVAVPVGVVNAQKLYMRITAAFAGVRPVRVMLDYFRSCRQSPLSRKPVPLNRVSPAPSLALNLGLRSPIAHIELESSPRLGVVTLLAVGLHPIYSAIVLRKLCRRLFSFTTRTNLSIDNAMGERHFSAFVAYVATGLRAFAMPVKVRRERLAYSTAFAHSFLYNGIGHGMNLLNRFVCGKARSVSQAPCGPFFVHAAGRTLTALSASVPAYSPPFAAAPRASAIIPREALLWV